MIDKNESRIGIFGASETSIIVSNPENKTYKKFIKEKAGTIERKEISNKYMFAGNALEPVILDYIEELEGRKIERDKQFWDEENNLRVNLDGNTKDCIFEAKTRRIGKMFFDEKAPKEYVRQVQAQMYGSKIYKAKIVILYLHDNQYEPMELIGFEIKPQNIKIFEIEYDEAWIVQEYLPKLRLANEKVKQEMEQNNESLLQ